MVNKFKIMLGISALFLACCSSKPPTHADIIGRWVMDPTSLHFLKTAGPSPKCEITFNADGTFSTPGVPDVLVAWPSEIAWKLVSGKGRWSIEKFQGYDIVRLEFNEIDGKSVNLGTHQLNTDIGNGDSSRLYFWSEDEGSARFQFQRAK